MVIASKWALLVRPIADTVILVEATGKIIKRSPLTIFVPHAVDALLNSYHTKHFSISHLTADEVFLFTEPH